MVTPVAGPSGPVVRRGFWDWLLRDRRTGAITVAQAPNAPLLVWLGATLLQLVWDPQVGGHSVLAAVSTVALVIWAADELVRGVNPFRRMLGIAVLAWLAWSRLH